MKWESWAEGRRMLTVYRQFVGDDHHSRWLERRLLADPPDGSGVLPTKVVLANERAERRHADERARAEAGRAYWARRAKEDRQLPAVYERRGPWQRLLRRLSGC